MLAVQRAECGVVNRCFAAVWCGGGSSENKSLSCVVCVWSAKGRGRSTFVRVLPVLATAKPFQVSSKSLYHVYGFILSAALLKQ